jgi:hypothetical protein
VAAPEVAGKQRLKVYPMLAPLAAVEMVQGQAGAED